MNNKNVNMKFQKKGEKYRPKKGDLFLITMMYDRSNKHDTTKYVGFYLGYDEDGNCLFAADNESNKHEATLVFEKEEEEFILSSKFISRKFL